MNLIVIGIIVLIVLIIILMVKKRSSRSTPHSEGAQEQPQAIEDEIRRLRELVTQINDRLTALESGQRITAPPPQPIPTSTAQSQEVAPIPAAAAPPRKEKPARVKDREWEQILGGSWLARIGVLALIIGVGFFLKFAFDNDWIGPTGRVILGIVGGLAMLVLGYYWRRRYPILTRVLSGGGIAILYLSIFASFVHL